MPSYYTLKTSTDLKIIGDYPQIDNISVSMHESIGTPQSYKNILGWEFPKVEPNLDYFILHKKAKLTDVVSVGMLSVTGFIISDKFYSLLSGLRLCPHRIYRTRLNYKNLYFNYHFLHLVNNSFADIDFEKSKFYISDIGTSKIEDIIINNEEDYQIKRKKLLFEHKKSIRAERLVFKDSFNNNPLDLFYFTGLHFYVFISERLKNLIEDHNVSGVTISNQKII